MFVVWAGVINNIFVLNRWYIFSAWSVSVIVSFYNFAWKDYGFGSSPNILDIVRVMQFAISEGKVAVHCHAGLGKATDDLLLVILAQLILF